MKSFVLTDNDIKKALDRYTREAAENTYNLKSRVMSRLPRRVKTLQQIYFRRILVTAVSVILLIAFFVYTPVGVAFATAIKENIIDKLFPPKEISVNLEGFEEEITHQPWTGETADEGYPDYVIYIDQALYDMAEENETVVIRPVPVVYSRDDILEDMGHLWEGLSEEEINKEIDERVDELKIFYSGLPECKIEIVKTRNISPEEAAAAERLKLISAFANVTGIEKSELTDGLFIRAVEGTQWDSQVKEVYFIDNQNGGSFVLTAQYYMEATEGHGARFRKMIESFTVITKEELISE